MSFVLVLLSLNGCTLFKTELKTSPYLREVRMAYDADGKVLEGYATLPVPYLEHMLKDLDACYKDAN